MSRPYASTDTAATWSSRATANAQDQTVSLLPGLAPPRAAIAQDAAPPCPRIVQRCPVGRFEQAPRGSTA
eukprot:11818363-Alexandrium_andersonii.AAC.1